MKISLFTTLLLMIIVIAGSAVYYLDEEFEGIFPPAGWNWYTVGSGSGNWQVEAGPWDNCAKGFSSGGQTEYISSILRSVPFTVTPGITMYFRFDYERDQTSSGLHNAFFYIGLPPDPVYSMIYFADLPVSGWKVFSASTTAIIGSNYQLAFRVDGGYGTPPGQTNLRIDNVLVSNQPFVDVSPASLGSIKSSFR